MGISLYLSIGAIIIACISLAWSIYLGYRDRGNIKATSEISYNGPDSKYFHLQVKAVNCIEKESARLSENEKYGITIRAGDSETMSPDGEEAVDFWFEDTF